MSTRRIQWSLRALEVGAAAAAAAYATHAGLTWFRYGRSSEPRTDERDELLDTFMPEYEVVERHHVKVAAPAAVTFAAAREQDLLGLPLVRLIFKAREFVLARNKSRGRGGSPGRAPRPWEPDVTFHAIALFSEPGFVKIAWTLRADPINDCTSVFLTETRAIATDESARVRFRRYWAFASPGISLIRRFSLGPLKRDAERRFSAPLVV